MKREIGGYFELEPSGNGNEYYSNLIGLNSGRNAFLFFVKAKNIKKIYIPVFLCDSIANICIRENIEFEKYHINSYFEPIINKTIMQDELVYIVNYYGQLTPSAIANFQSKFNNILIDNVQCFYTKPIEGVPTIYSCRKYFGVPDGGYLYCQNINLMELKKDSSHLRMKHLLGRKHESAKKHYDEYLENEKLIYNLPILFMSDETKKIMMNIDNLKIIEIRNKNYDYLSKRLNSLNCMQLLANDGPFCYPLMIRNGYRLRQHLIKHNVFVPRLWPGIEKECNSFEKKMSLNVLPIPCDQRYSIKEMSYICDIIEAYVK